MSQRFEAPVVVLKERFSKLTEWMKEQQLDLCWITNPAHQVYMIDCSIKPRLQGSLLVSKEGQIIRIIAQGSAQDHPKNLNIEVKEFTAYDMHHWADAQANEMQLVEQTIAAFKSQRVGVDFPIPLLTHELIHAVSTLNLVDLRPFLRSIKLCKASYELERIRYGGKINQAIYDCIRQELRDGMTEFELLTKMMNIAWFKAGQPVHLDSKYDLVSGIRSLKAGGPATNKIIVNGETVIVDLFPTVNGYHTDNCRTFAVGEKTGLQLEVHQVVLNSLKKAETLLVPGIKASEIFNEVNDELRRIGRGFSLFHHVGHGIGVEDQEGPFLISGSEDLLEEGMVISVEPGIYIENVGIRIENAYAVTRNGPVNLTPFQMDL